MQPRYDVPGAGITEVVIDEDVIMGRAEPRYIYTESINRTRDRVDSGCELGEETTGSSASFMA